jgi:hypothetical protein
MVGIAKKIFRWFLRLLVLATALWFVFFLLGQVLRKIAVAQISELTNTKIKTSVVDFHLDGSVLIEGLVIRPDRKEEYDNAILKAETVYARFDLSSLFLLRPRLKEIKVNDFVFNVQEDLDTNHWNISALTIRPPRGSGGKMPLVRLKEGKIQYTKISNHQPKLAGEIPVEAKFEFDEKKQNGYSFEIVTARREGFAERSSLKGFWRSGEIEISGGLSSTDIPIFEKVWMIYVLAARLEYDRRGDYSLELVIQDLQNRQKSPAIPSCAEAPSFLAKFGIFVTLQKFFQQYNPQGWVDINLRATGSLNAVNESRLVGKVFCKDISIYNSKFPYYVEHIKGEIEFTEESILLNNLVGKHSDVELCFNGWIKDFGENRQYEINITSDNMVLNEDLFNALSKKQQKVWLDFSPSSTSLVSMNCSLSRKQQSDKKRTLELELLNAEAIYKNFPYPLKNLTGKLFFDSDIMTISNVISRVKDQEIALNGKVISSDTGRRSYDISIAANNLPFDSTLTEALPAAERDLYSKFAEGGLICIGQLTGRIRGTSESEQPSYSLSIHTKPFELNEDLFSILPEQFEKIVAELQPEGPASLALVLNKTDRVESPEYAVTVKCLGNSVNFNKFPYPLAKDGDIELKDVTAIAADNVQISANAPAININGRLTLDGNTFRQGRFQVSANDILFDDRLGIALPKAAQPFYLKLSPTGRFDLRNIDIKISETNDGKKYADFEGFIEFKACNINAPSAITEISAVLKAKGLYQTDTLFGDIEASIIRGSLRVAGKSLTDMKADIFYDRNLQSLSAKDFVADFYDGRLTGNLELNQLFSTEAGYILQTSFENVDLKQFLSDTNSPENGRDECTDGRMDGLLSVSGKIEDNYRRIGRCRLRITGMEVGRLSPLAKLLHVLKLGESTDFAFDQMLVDSYIKKNRLFFDRFDLSGKALAFNGSGWMGLQEQDINLVLMARGQRLATAEPSLLQSLTDALGHGVVRMEVKGDLYNPEVTTTSLPVIKDTLGLLGTKPIVSE